MKILLSLCLLALSVSTIKSQCTLDNCNSCSNPGPECSDCPDGFALAQDEQSCIECGTNCEECTADASGNAPCDTCAEGTYLTSDGTCSDCSDGCKSCALNTESVLVCNECFEDGYTQDTSAEDQGCVECPSNCQTCSLVDGATVCSKCFTYAGFDIQGYFLRTSDKTCTTCGSKASKCTDNGEGSASISDCYSGYVVQSDNTRCLACPSTCSDCSGEELDGSATCTGCVDGLGNFLVDGKCESCTDNCLSCSDDVNCATCDEGFRVDGGSCEACTANCDECSVDDDIGDVCDDCASSYGTKLSTSITCDKCTESNCKVCSMDVSSGAHSCSTCMDGYAKNGDDVCTQCPTACTECEWVADDGTGASYMLCTACPDTYALFPANADSTAADSSTCILCTRDTANCIACTDADPPVCETCDTGYYLDGSDACQTQSVANCADYNDNENTCATCETGYGINADFTACVECTANDCVTCDDEAPATCDSTCAEGYEFITPDCIACGISRCTACTTTDGTTLCDTCETGYTVYDKDTESTSQGVSCKKCPTGCDSCDYDYANSQTVCASDGCSDGYAYDNDGGCEECTENCATCTVTDGVVGCDGCIDGAFTLTENTPVTCDACPDNCDTCEWDTDSSQVVCSDGGCNTGYGKISGGQCSECPSSCDECSVEDETEQPDLLTCTTCENGYAMNELLCAACPSNCAECDDDSGSMVCNECNDGFALDSSTKECVSCFTNCDTCTSSNSVVKCSECDSGYSLSVDKLSCTACSTAAFENCMLCEDMTADSETALCNACTTDYTLQDEDQEGPCIDVSSLDCDAVYRVDEGPMCTACADGFTVTEEGECAITCYQCGDIDTETGISIDSCQIPADNSTEGASGFATTIECTIGVCVTYRFDDGTVATGCAPDAYSCTDEKQSEFCQEGTGARCEKCCTEDSCNDDPDSLDGTAFGIPSCTANFLLLTAAALLAIFRV